MIPSGRTLVLLGAMAVALALGPAAATAATITVTSLGDDFGTVDSGTCSLREAIEAANTDGNFDGCVVTDDPADTIVLQSGMTYGLSLVDSPSGENENVNGDLDVLTEPVTIQASGAGRATIDANTATTGDRVLDLAPDDVALSSVTLTRLVITDGGNLAGGGGAGVREGDFVSSLSIVDSRVTANHAPAGGIGGGLLLDGPLTTITDSTIDLNTADNAGGIFASPATPSALNITGSTINNNEAKPGEGDGGGIFVGANETATLRNTTVTANKANADGGGIESNGTLTLANVTVEENGSDDDTSGTGDGGGIHIPVGTPTVRNSIFSDNSDPSGGTVHNDCSGVLDSQGFNLIEDSTGCTGTVGTDLLDMGAAGVGSLANNGGPTFTHAILGSGSLAFNAGNPATPGTAAPACEATDQRGLPRGGSAGQCDIGAFELQLTPPVTTLPATTPPATTTPTTPAKKCPKGRKLKKGKCVKKKKKK